MKDDLAARFAAARAQNDDAALAHCFAAAASVQAAPTGRAFMLTQALALGLGEGLPETSDWLAQLRRLGAEPPG